MKKIVVLLIGLMLFSCVKKEANEKLALDSFTEQDLERHAKI